MAASAQINLGIIPTPELPAAERKTLLDGLQKALDGAKVTISIKYHKVTKSKARIEGEDYESPLPPQYLIGEVKKVAVGKNGPYILLDATATRNPDLYDDADDLDAVEDDTAKKVGWTSIKGKGIDKVLKVTTPKTKKATTAQ